MVRRRLTAFDVSFPEERDDSNLMDPTAGTGSRDSSLGSVRTSSLGKRKGAVDGDARVS